jgi:hypothetical protein
MLKNIVFLAFFVTTVLSRAIIYPILNQETICLNCTTIGWHCYLFDSSQTCTHESNETSILTSCPTLNTFFTNNNNNSINMEAVVKNNCLITKFFAQIGERSIPLCDYINNITTQCEWNISNANTLNILLPCLILTVLTALLLF